MKIWIRIQRLEFFLSASSPFPENICCSSSAPIGSSDHVVVKVDISLVVIREPPQRHRVWHFTQADWQGLQADIKLLDWSPISNFDSSWWRSCSLHQRLYSSLSMHCPHSPTPPGIPLAMASLHSHLMFICVLYRPPNSDDSIYTSLSENMDQLLSSHPNALFLICGDFNCHHASWLGVVPLSPVMAPQQKLSATHWD